jgi:hypothetical protein
LVASVVVVMAAAVMEILAAGGSVGVVEGLESEPVV